PALAAAVRALDGVAGVDPALDELAARARAVALEADDLAGELRRYGDGADAEGDPAARLDEVEERLGQLERLKRKHGGSIAAVLGHAAACRKRRDELTGAEEAIAEAEAEAAAAGAERERHAAAL